MATLNPFDLLGDDDAEDPSLLIAAQQQKVESKKVQAATGKPAPGGKQAPTQAKAAAPAKLPSKPLPPSQSVREARSESARGGRGGGGGRGYGRGGRGGGGSFRDSTNNENSYGSREVSAVQGGPDEADGRQPYERRGGYGGAPRGSFRGGRRGGFSNGEGGEGDRDLPRRTYDRRSGTGRGNEVKRDGAGRGNWGTDADDVVEVAEEVPIEGEKPVNVEKPVGEEDATAEGDKEAVKNETEEKEPEDKEMTLEEYEKLQEEKRKPLLALKSEERKVDASVFATMQPLSNKKSNDDIFIKLGSEKDKKKELSEKEERAKKSLSINEFLKPAEGERYYSGGRGRGRGRGSRGGYSGGSDTYSARAPAIEDPGQFPTLGGK